jgi:hypothetical protein
MELIDDLIWKRETATKTYQNPKKTSVIVSAVVNNAKTTQYIIHLTCQKYNLFFKTQCQYEFE